MRSLSRTSAIVISFFTGMAAAVLLIFLIGVIISTSYTISDLEEKTAIPVVSDKYIGDTPEVYLRDMTLVQMLKEGKELADMGDNLTLNLMINRYDLKLPDKADVFLTAAVRDLPLKTVFSEEGMDIIMNTVYIGEFKGYEKREVEGELVWYDPLSGEAVSGINKLISGLTIAQVTDGGFTFSSLLDDITLGEALGYKIIDGEYYDNGVEVSGLIGSLCDSPVSDISGRVNNVQLAEIFDYELVDGVYYDKNGKKVTGIMSVICDANVNGVPDKVNTAKFCDILGYELGEDGCYYENGVKVSGVMSIIADCTVTNAPNKIETANLGEIMGYSYDSESATWKDSEGNDIHAFMNTISGKKINELNNLYKDLTIADVIPADERGENKGYVSLLNSETPLNEISGEVNRVFKEKTMKEFVESGAITFENDPDGTKAQRFADSKFGDMTMDGMIGFVVKNLDLLESLP